MPFSKRTDWDTEESDLARAHRERLASGLPIADLTASNPTRCGFNYPVDLLQPLTDPAGFDYDPEAKGSLIAREAVCDYYCDHGVFADPAQMLLTTSTSEAYSYLFKLLCDPRETILVLQPSYPLFEFLADAEVVQLTPATMFYDHGWQIEMESLRRAVTPSTRAIILVHPNNPTGHFTTRQQARELAALCREYQLALIVDEVFLDYPLLDSLFKNEPVPLDDRTSFAARDLGVLTFVVSGISKICGLPQMKLAWLLAVGPGSSEAMQRLEVLADTYLSLNSPVQLALPAWLSQRAYLQHQIQDRVQANLAELDSQLSVPRSEERLLSRLKVEGGWYAVLRIPATQTDESTALELLERGVLVHPGYFFGFPRSGWLVLSLLGEPSEFARGIALLSTYFQWHQASY